MRNFVRALCDDGHRTSCTTAHDAQREAILNNIPDQAWLKDLECRYLAVNEAYMEASGLSENNILGRLPSDIWPSKLATKYLDTDRQVVETQRRYRYEERRRDRTGQFRWYDTIKSPVRNGRGEIIGTAGISRDISELKSIEQELIESRSQLRELSAHLRSIREAEQTRISRELHDELGQDLTALRMGLDSAQRQLLPNQDVLAGRLARLRELATGTVGKMQSIAQELRPVILDDLGLEAAVESLLESFAERSELIVKAHINIDDTAYDSEVSTTIFRILQESLTNTSRHADTNDVAVDLFESKGFTRLIVADGGKGIDCSNTDQTTCKLGLLGMHERAKNVGGWLEITGTSGCGTVVRLSIPIEHTFRDVTPDDRNTDFG